MNKFEENQQEEMDYLDAIMKAHDFKKAVNKLTPQNKERFIKELTGSAITIKTIDNVLSMIKGGSY